MLKHIRNYLLNNTLYFAILISVLIVVLSLINTKVVSGLEIQISDKFLHGFAYMGLMWSWLLAFYNKTKKPSKLLLFVILTGFGILLEVLQGKLGIQRTTDKMDVVANTFGLLIASISFKYVYSLVFK